MKDFIPYEQALELKELGFDEPCLFAFDNCSTPMRCSDLRTSEQKFNGVNYNSSSYTSQPTFSQAFRFFRDKYKIISTIHFYCDGDKWEDVVYEVRISEFEHFKTHDSFVQSEFKTYEEAELACIIKLIEIVKEKKD
jgi:hypothetical protein